MDPLWSETCWSTFKYFIILIVSTYNIWCIMWEIKCLIIIDARCKHEAIILFTFCNFMVRCGLEFTLKTSSTYSWGCHWPFIKYSTEQKVFSMLFSKLCFRPDVQNVFNSTSTTYILWWLIFFRGATGLLEPRSPDLWGFEITHNDAQHCRAPLWTRNQPVAEASVWQHTTDRLPYHRRGSKPESQEMCSHRHTS